MSGEISKNETAFTDFLLPVRGELESLEKRLEEDCDTFEPAIAQILKYSILSSGKRLRPAICFLLTKALNRGIVTSNHFNIGLLTELIHAASLVHDDIVDNSDTRRCKDSVWKKWGQKTSVLTGDIILAVGLGKIASIKNHAVTEIFARSIREICSAEILQLNSRNELPTMESYIKTCRQKTAVLFAAGAESCAVMAYNADNMTIKAAREYAINLGIAFQITDDILNIKQTGSADKPVLLDIKNGNCTAPVIFAMHEAPITGNIGEMSDEVLLELIRSTSAIEKAEELALQYAENAKKALMGLNEDIYKDALIKLADFSVKRMS